MNPDYLTIAAEYIAASQQVQILSLRSSGIVKWEEVSEVTRNLPRFLDMPKELIEKVKEIRFQKYNIS